MQVRGKVWGLMKCRTCCRGAEPSPWACGGMVLTCLSCIPVDVSISPRERYSCRASSEVFGNVNVTFPAPSCWHKDRNVSVLVKNPQILFSSKVRQASLVPWCCQGTSQQANLGVLVSASKSVSSGCTKTSTKKQTNKCFRAHKNSFYTCCRPFSPNRNGQWCGGVLVPWRLYHPSRVWPRGTAVLLPLRSSAAPSRTMFFCFALGEKIWLIRKRWLETCTGSSGASITQLYLFIERVLDHLEIIRKRRKVRISFSINSAEMMKREQNMLKYSCNIKISGKK